MTSIDQIKAVAAAFGVTAGMRLSNVSGSMPEPLEKLLRYLHSHIRTQSHIANILNTLGVLPADGDRISNSNVSNTMRKALGLRRAPRYEKENYKGKNWLYFRQP